MQKPLLYCSLLSLAGYFVTWQGIPVLARYTLKAGLAGRDLGKKGTKLEDKLVPESLGVVPGIVFLMCIVIEQLFYSKLPFPLSDYHAALLSICFMLFLGFADDVLDLPWRIKFLLPSIACMPLLAAYSGITHVVIPHPLRWLLASGESSLTPLGEVVNMVVQILPDTHGGIVDLGMLYYVYMGLLAVFTTNAINIYAGVNGLEVGQAFIIAAAVLTHNVLELSVSASSPHLFSAMLLLPFLACTLALLRANWFPARVFVGDTFCYFAGMTLAVTAVLGHFSKSLLLFLLPQIINFLYSIPQLLKLVPCPRHRLPSYDSKHDVMRPSVEPTTGYVNMTLINLTLRVCGPMREETLTTVLLAFQFLCCLLGFWLRYPVADALYTMSS
eukprot:PLAT8378.1.p1 GENE.PLAT8378.1~~PLAT8378.1.p1  ORF type:complete len:436 (+),score=180.14 PLAT8378.1:152-1309(+)